MSSNPLRLKLLLEKYLASDCTPQELEEFWTLMSELSENDLVSQELAALWERMPDQTREPAWDQLYTRLQQKIGESDIDMVQVMTVKRPGGFKKIAIAASVLLALLTAWWLMPASKPAPTLHVQLPATQQNTNKVIKLPDGSIVTLNENSELDYPATFQGKNREVSLKGEAFFEVVPDKSKPFLVRTGSIVTRVLGTSFNIKATGGTAPISVTVSTGKVQVQQDNKTVLAELQAGDQLIIDKAAIAPLRTKANMKEVLVWKNDEPVFEDVTLETAIPLINQYYGVNIQIRDESLRTKKFTGNFINDPMKQALDVICKLTNAQWQKGADSTIWLDKRF
ncbi:FecR family protein [Chitinophaga arvensicola]|uniref:Ferric-dicitrate binding protein FerR, regulates iron transport through sigma-19 n=1 Tax=Chitinophaga arvensicola TaxID=29529 RepID=A0A1I0RMW2_9BACT|nr:FecR domain-containing protein [Chitinophaga arvensicola]SEW42546.1 ferric-dicitrate binding protein FerR, regulates iron transport through sigma-19 [Chitinophaga arvensicola]